MDKELKENLKKAAAEERKKLSAMTFGEKLDYLWTYYKIWLAVGAVVIFFVYLVGNMVYKSTFNTAFGVAVVNDTSSYGNDRMAGWADELHDVFGLGKKDVVDVEYNITIDFNMQDEMSYASMAKMSALVASKTIDVMLTDYSAAENYEKNLAFKDLREVLPEAQYQKLLDEGRILSFDVQLDARGNAVGIAASGVDETQTSGSAGKTGTDAASAQGVSGQETTAQESAGAAAADGTGTGNAAETAALPSESEAVPVETVTIPCLIELEPEQLEAVSGITAQPMYLGVISNSDRDEMTLKFIDYMLGETAS